MKDSSLESIKISSGVFLGREGRFKKISGRRKTYFVTSPIEDIATRFVTRFVGTKIFPKVLSLGSLIL
jgi:hypothetical protein